MFSRFFVRRPVFAWVIAILIMLAGILAIRTCPSRNILTLRHRPLKFQPLILVLLPKRWRTA